jgi:catechol 2,3-dioxygenase-like lactoylglutathione lyase family enzyme
MAATGVNHVSVAAPDLEASTDFYEQLFGARRVPAPNFGFPVRWLAVGDAQLHLFERDDDAPPRNHFALTVDDFEAIYERARQRGAFETEAFGHHLNELPGDVLQLYLRDPAGNLVEVNAPGASRVAPEIRREVRRLADVREQSEDNLSARLYLSGASG